MLIKQENGINYYVFGTYFECFRKSMNKTQVCNTQIEVGIDKNNKICSYKETKIENLRYINRNN